MNSGICTSCNAYSDDHRDGLCPSCRGGMQGVAFGLKDGFILSTESCLQGIVVDRRIGIVTGEAVSGINAVRDFFASFRDVVGGRVSVFEAALREAKDAAIADLERNARQLGANGVIAVDIDYSELSGGTKNSMIFVVANGTAVKLRDA